MSRFLLFLATTPSFFSLILTDNKSENSPGLNRLSNSSCYLSTGRVHAQENSFSPRLPRVTEKRFLYTKRSGLQQRKNYATYAFLALFILELKHCRYNSQASRAYRLICSGTVTMQLNLRQSKHTSNESHRPKLKAFNF